MSIHDEAVTRAVILLKAAKAEFVIRKADGELLEWGLVAQNPSGKRRRKETKPRRRWSETYPGCHRQVQKMQVGDVLQWTLPNAQEADGFRKIITSAGCRFHGNKNTISSTTVKSDSEHVVEIMRVT